jgi:ABC-type proline/glycine betaine transport system ATPase subunit
MSKILILNKKDMVLTSIEIQQKILQNPNNSFTDKIIINNNLFSNNFSHHSSKSNITNITKVSSKIHKFGLQFI